MRKVCFCIIVLAIFLCVGISYAEGKYQLVTCGDQLFRIDTQTGTVWRYATMEEMKQRKDAFMEAVKQKIIKDEDRVKFGIKFISASSWSGTFIEVLDWDERPPIK